MSADSVLREASALWQSDTAEMFRVLPEKLQAGAERIDRNLRHSGRRLYGILGAELLAFAAFLLAFRDPIERVGSALTLLGLGYLTLQVRAHQASALALARATQADPSFAFYRALLVRMRDFHRGVWFWSRLAVFLPGPTVFLWGVGRAHPDVAAQFHAILAVFLLLGVLAVPLNVWLAAGRYQKRLDELDRVARDA